MMNMHALGRFPCVPTHLCARCTVVGGVGGVGGGDHYMSDARNLCSHASIAAMMAITQTCLPPYLYGLQARDTLLEVGRRPLPRVRLRCPQAAVEGLARSGETRIPARRVPSRVWSLHTGEERWYT